MSLRRQLPVHSPLPVGALLRGATSLVFGPQSSHSRVIQWFRSEFGAERPLLTNSGTAALTLALRASQSQGRSAILLPAYGCFDLVTAALGAEVPVRWYDLDPATLGPDWSSLRSALSPDTAAIVAVHFYGVPVDFHRLRGMLEPTGILIIEDAAQGIGGTLDQRPLGGLGDLAVLSFGRGKGLTSGGGGALYANTAPGQAALSRAGPELEHASGALRTLASSSAQWLLARPSTYAIPAALPFLKLGETVFRPPEPPGAMNRAALGILAQTIGRARTESDVRRRNAERLIAALRGRLTIPSPGIGSAGYLRLPGLIPPAHPGLLGDHLASGLGVMPGYPRTLPSLPGPTASALPFPGAASLVRSLITFPVHSLLSEDDIVRLEQWIEDSFPP